MVGWSSGWWVRLVNGCVEWWLMVWSRRWWFGVMDGG